MSGTTYPSPQFQSVGIATAAPPNGVLGDFSNGSITSTGSTTPRTSGVRAADTANALDFGAVPSGSTTVDNAPAINAALATGKPVRLPTGTYHVMTQISMQAGSVLFGDGRNQTFITVSDNFSPTATGVISMDGREQFSPILENLSISFAQPSTQSSRANFKTLAAGGTSSAGGTGVMYPPAIIINTSNRLRIRHVQIAGAWDGIVGGTGASDVGGANFVDVEMGALHYGIQLGKSSDVVRIIDYHFWNFGFSGNLFTGVFQDGNVFGGRFGDNGGANGITAVNFFSYMGQVYFTGGTNCWANITNLMLDVGGTLEVASCNFVQVTNMYLTGGGYGANTNAAIKFGTTGGGTLQLTNVNGGSASHPTITHLQGVLHISNSTIGANGPAQSAIVQSGGQLFVDTTSISVSDGAFGAWTVPVVQSTGGTIHFTANRFTVRGPTPLAVPALSIAADNAANYVADNNWNNWGFTAPGTLGFYSYNSDGSISGPLAINGGVVTLGTGVGGANFIANGGSGSSTRGMTCQGGGTTIFYIGGTNTNDFGLNRYVSGTATDFPILVSNATGAVTLGSSAANGQLNFGATSGPNIRGGAGVASGTQPKGSIWLRTDGAVGSTMYVSQGGGTWNAIAGV